MAIFMFGPAAALVVMIVGIGVAFSKDAMELIDFGYDPNDPSSGPRRMLRAASAREVGTSRARKFRGTDGYNR